MLVSSEHILQSEDSSIIFFSNLVFGSDGCKDYDERALQKKSMKIRVNLFAKWLKCWWSDCEILVVVQGWYQFFYVLAPSPNKGTGATPGPHSVARVGMF